MDRGRDFATKRARFVGFGCAALLALALGLTGAVSLTSATASLTSSARRIVPGELPGLSRAKLLGIAPASHVMEVGIGIAFPNQSGENAFFHAVYDRSSPDYHHFLTVKQFQKRFGVSPSTDTAVRSWLTQAGLKNVRSSNPAYFTATGTVSQLDKLFTVKIGDYSYKGKRFIANNTAPHVPATLPINGVLGLDTAHQMQLSSLTSGLRTRSRSPDAVSAGRTLISSRRTESRCRRRPLGCR